MPTRIIVRRLQTEGDLVEADRLYREHAGAFLPTPDPEATWASITAGEVFGCFEDGGRLLAVGGTYLVAKTSITAGKIVAIYEMAGLVVHPDARPMKPCSLQDVLVAVRVAALAAQEATGVCLITSIATDNRGSRSSMGRCGLHQLPEDAIPLWLRDVRRTWLPGKIPDVVDYIALPSAVSNLRGVFQTISEQTMRRESAGGGATEFTIVLGDPGDLHLVLQRDAPLDRWAQEVPVQRVIEKDGGFFNWPRV